MLICGDIVSITDGRQLVSGDRLACMKYPPHPQMILHNIRSPPLLTQFATRVEPLFQRGFANKRRKSMQFERSPAVIGPGTCGGPVRPTITHRGPARRPADRAVSAGARRQRCLATRSVRGQEPPRGGQMGDRQLC